MKIHIQNCLVPASVLPGWKEGGLKLKDADLNPAIEARITVEDGIVKSIKEAASSFDDSGAIVHDLGGRLLTPRLLDAHVHLDKAHTWFRAPNRSGTFGEAIQVLSADKENWTYDDLYSRANYTLQCAYAHGTTAVRTHVDTGLPWAETSHHVMADLRSEWKGRIDLQTVSLCGVDQYDGPDGPALADLPLKYGAAALGGMPLMNPDLDRQLDALLRLAAEREIGIDLHVDENGDPQARTLLAVAEAVLRNKFPYPVTCGHCCSLAVQEPEMRDHIINRVVEAGIHIISLPLCNLYLQDRYTTEAPKTSTNQTPFWRGVTLVNEWMDAGAVTACASDNVRDAFYAYGDLDAFEVFQQSVRIGHLDNNLHRAFDVVTRGPARIMGLEEAGVIAPGTPARFIAFGTRSWSEWLSRPTQTRELFESTEWIQPQVPDYPAAWT